MYMPTTIVVEFFFPPSSLAFIIRIFDHGDSDRCEVMLHCFGMYFSNN